MARRRAEPATPLPTTVVLDSEALSVLATPNDRGISRRRAAAVLAVAAASGSRVIVPAPVLAEVGRTRGRARAVDAILPKLSIVSTDRRIAQRAGLLLGQSKRTSADAIDAFVAATAAEHRPAVVLTSDPAGDLRPLAAGLSNVEVQTLDA